MSFIDQKDKNNFTTGSTHPHYKNIPLDLTVSPLEEYFRNMYLLSINENPTNKEPELVADNAAALSSDEFLMTDSKSKPILIPGAVVTPNEVRIKKRRNRRERLSIKVPNTRHGFAALLDMASRQPLFPFAQETQSTNTRYEIRKKSTFTVGSLLVDRPPVPWPTSITAAAHDGKRRHRSLRQQKNDEMRNSLKEDDIFLYEEDNCEHVLDHASGMSNSY